MRQTGGRPKRKLPLLSLVGTTNQEAQRGSFLIKWYDDWGVTEELISHYMVRRLVRQSGGRPKMKRPLLSLLGTRLEFLFSPIKSPS